jgi:cytochrome P450
MRAVPFPFADSMIQLIALDSVFGDYRGGSATGVRAGLVHKGEKFWATERDAERLESRGLAMRYFEPRPVASFVPKFEVPSVQYQTKVVEPEQTAVIVPETQPQTSRNRRRR